MRAAAFGSLRTPDQSAHVRPLYECVLLYLFGKCAGIGSVGCRVFVLFVCLFAGF